MCNRHECEVHELKIDWGKVFTDEEVEKALLEVKPKMLMVVHAETSTGAL